jgi:hypothetical protein
MILREDALRMDVGYTYVPQRTNRWFTLISSGHANARAAGFICSAA